MRWHRFPLVVFPVQRTFLTTFFLATFFFTTFFLAIAMLLPPEKVKLQVSKYEVQ